MATLLQLFSSPTGMVKVGTNLYVADTFNHLIRKIDLSNTNYTVTTFAGSGTAGTADGTGTAAQFRNPRDITSDGTYLYVGDSNHIRRITLATQVVLTIAGALNSTTTGTLDAMAPQLDLTASGASLTQLINCTFQTPATIAFEWLILAITR